MTPEFAVECFWKACVEDGDMDSGALKAAMAAYVGVPVAQPQGKPAWHDAPTVPGLWVSDFSWMAQKLGRETVEFYAKNRSIPSRRWYGPISEDKP